MTKLNDSDGLWLKDFGSGVTSLPEKAHDFTPDEVLALVALYRYPMPSEIIHAETTLDDKPEPMIPAGDDMVWVKYQGCWLAAERQALFMGTRNALNRAKAEEPRYA